MKINIEFDMTPEEFRVAMGLPDVAELQSQLMASMIKKIELGEEGYDPFTLLKPFLDSSLVTAETLQKNFFGLFAAQSKK